METQKGRSEGENWTNRINRYTGQEDVTLGLRSPRFTLCFAFRIANQPLRMAPDSATAQTVRITGLSNREFLELYSRPGRIGLSGGRTWLDKAICRAERHLDEHKKWGAWSHAFLFQGERLDGHHWVIESDLQVHRRHIHLGVQENRISKYFDEELYTTLAVLDFGLTETQVTEVLRQGLELVANRALYSLRELLGTLVALRRPELRPRENVLARESSMYCSAFVQYVFRQAGLDLAPGVDMKNTTPEDLARTTVPHVTFWLHRVAPRTKLTVVKLRLHRRFRARARQWHRRKQL
jgi:hypothetical protein